MVYCGKPSRGCQNCKTRRIKCDEERPHCGQCIKSKRSCPGYPDEFDLIFRNETAAVKRRAHRSSSNATQKSLSPRTTRKPKATPPDYSTEWDGAVINFSPEYDQVYVLDEERSPGSKSFSPWLRRLDVAQIGPLEPGSLDAVLRSPILGRTKREPSPPVELLSPRSMDSPTARIDTAIAFWFKHLLQVPRLPDALRGYMEILGPMYMKAKHNSILHQATKALALAALSNGRRSVLLRMEARKLYAKALINTGEAIKDPKQAKSDELLMAIMLFSLYETIISAPDLRTLWTKHVDGAVTLVKLRGEEMLSNPVSLHLFQAVRTHMLTSAIQQQRLIDDFPHEKGWLMDEDLDINAANRLTLISINLPNMKYYATDLLVQSKDTKTIVEMMKLIKVAKTTDNALEHWALTLDPVWDPDTKFTIAEEPEDAATATCWKGPVHVYHDLSVAALWNDYRICRIFCQAIILGCVAALPHHLRNGQIQRVSDQAVQITQQMVDDFSSSLPFLFGLPSEFESRKVSKLDQIAWRASGAYHAAWPLWVMSMTPTVPKRQREWLSARFSSIGKTWGLSDDQMLGMAQRHAMTTGPQFNYEEFGELRRLSVSPKPCAVEFERPQRTSQSHVTRQVS